MNDKDDNYLSKKKQEGSIDRSSINSLKQKLRERDRELEEFEEKVEDIEAKAKRRERKLQKELDQRIIEVEELSEELESEKKTCFKYKTQAKQLEKKVQALREDIDRIVEETRETERRTAETSRVEEDRLSLKDELQKMKQRQKSELKKLTNRNRTLEEEKEDLERQLMVRDKEMKSVEKALKRRIDELEIVKQSLEGEISTLNICLEESVRKEKMAKEMNDELNVLLKKEKIGMDDHRTKNTVLEQVVSDSRTSISSISISKKSVVEDSRSRCTSKSEVENEGEDRTMCPNCANYITTAEIEEHLERCLDDF